MLRSILKTRLGADAFTLVGVQGAIKLSALFGAVAAIRAIGPEDMGLVGRVSVFSGLIGVCAAMGLESTSAPMLRAREGQERIRQAERLLCLRLLLLLAGALLLLAIVNAVEFAHSGILTFYFFGLSILGAVVMILNGLSPITILQGYGSIRAIAVPQLVSAMGILLGNILVARFCPTGTAYLAVQALGTALIAVMVFRSLGLTFPRAACDFRALRSTWQEAVKSGTLSVYIANISIYIYGQGDALAVSLFSPQKNMGDFMGALGLIAATNSIIGVLPSVVYARQVEWNSMADAVLFRHKQMKLLGIIGGVAVLAGIVSVFVSPVVATLVLGSKFTGSPQIFLVLLLISFLNLPYAVVASGFLALKKPRPLMLINVVIAVISIPVYAGSAYCWGPTGAVFAKLALLILMTFAALYNQLKLFAEPRTIQ